MVILNSLQLEWGDQIGYDTKHQEFECLKTDNETSNRVFQKYRWLMMTRRKRVKSPRWFQDSRTLFLRFEGPVEEEHPTTLRYLDLIHKMLHQLEEDFYQNAILNLCLMNAEICLIWDAFGVTNNGNWSLGPWHQYFLCTQVNISEMEEKKINSKGIRIIYHKLI